MQKTLPLVALITLITADQINFTNLFKTAFISGGVFAGQWRGSFAAITIFCRARKGAIMAGVKLMVMYPRPKDIDAFEKLYQSEHVPMAVEKLGGKTKLVATRVTASPQGTPQYYRIAEVHFPSMEALQACAASAGGKETLAHAAKISSGGPPVMLIAEEESFTF